MPLPPPTPQVMVAFPRHFASLEWSSCRIPGRPFGSSALRASGTKRSTSKFSRIARNCVAVIRLKFARQLGHDISKMNKISKPLKIALLIIFVFAALIGGVVLGMKYHDFDVLCDNNFEAYVSTTDLRAENGIFLPKKTIIPLQKCEYARFSVKFYLTHLPDHIDVFVPFQPKGKKEGSTGLESWNNFSIWA